MLERDGERFRCNGGGKRAWGGGGGGGWRKRGFQGEIERTEYKQTGIYREKTFYLSITINDLQ